jgi:hypothetical protein
MEVEMKMVKSLLLGTAAGLVAVAGAQAADMPVKAKPVNYVKICTLYGDGFYYIPGTDTCLKLGGYVRVQTDHHAGGGGVVDGTFNQIDQAKKNRQQTNEVDFRVRGALSLDVRDQTEYGTLRMYYRFGVQVATPQNSPLGTSPATYWDRAFIQWAGFTVGRQQSFFDLFTYGGGMSYHNVRVGGDTGATGVELWAYTAQFGNGISATVSAEDPANRRGNTLDVTLAGFFPTGAAPPLTDNAYGPNTGGFGFRMPDVIANLRVDQAWGFAGVSVAVHNVSGAYYGANNVNNGYPSDRLGWAGAVGGALNLPGGDRIGANLWVAEGAPGFTTNNPNWQNYNGSTNLGLAWVTDAVFGTGGEIELTRSWAVMVGYEHRWNARWKTSLYGGYVEIDYSDAATALICANRVAGIPFFTAAQPAGFNCNPDFSFWEVGTRTQWNPHPNLDIGIDIWYTRLDTAFEGPANWVANGSRPACANVGTQTCNVSDQDVWSAIFRWQRNFYP